MESNWANPDYSIGTSNIDDWYVFLTTFSNITVVEAVQITEEVEHGKTTQIANITIDSTGNEEAIINLTLYGGNNTTLNSWITQNGNQINNGIQIGSNTPGYNINISVIIPENQPPQTYNTTLRIWFNNSIKEELPLNISILTDSSFSAIGNYSGGLKSIENDPPGEGEEIQINIGYINISNDGNTDQTFEISAGTSDDDISNVIDSYLDIYSETIDDGEIYLEMGASEKVYINFTITDTTITGFHTFYISITPYINEEISGSPFPIPTNYSLTNRPPNITDIKVLPTTPFPEFGKIVTIQANISDPHNISNAWLTINPPGGGNEIEIEMVQNQVDTEIFTANITPTTSGTYYFNINATDNDPSNPQSFTSAQNTFFVEAETDIYTELSPTEILITQITQTTNEFTDISLNISNLKNATAYEPTVQWSGLGDYISTNLSTDLDDDIPNIEAGETVTRSYRLTINKGTPPGLYTATATTQWQYPDEEYYYPTETDLIQFNVTSNKEVKLSGTQISTINHGNRK